MVHFFTRLALIALALLVAVPAFAQETAPSGPLGPLDGQVLVGRDGDWEGGIVDGRYRLQNLQGKPSAVRYFHALPPFRGQAGVDGWTIGADVGVQPAGERAFAGLLYAFVDSPRHYLIFALAGDGKAVLWRRTAQGIEVVAESPPVPGRTATALRVVETPDRVLFLVEGDLLAELGPGQVVEGSVGIVAGGRGVFDFGEIVWDVVTVQRDEPEPPLLPAEVPPPLPTASDVPPPLPTAQAAEPVPPPLPAEPVPEQPPVPDTTPAGSLGALGGSEPEPAPPLGALGGAASP